MVSRFVAEARAVNQIRHRNIIDIFAFGAARRRPPLLRDGVPRRRCRSTRYLRAARRACRSTRRCRSCARSRARSTPRTPRASSTATSSPRTSSSRTTTDGGVFPKLLDFGIAKLLGAERRRRAQDRAPARRSARRTTCRPSSAAARDVDHRTDIYAFGVRALRDAHRRACPFDGDDYMEHPDQAHHRGAAAAVGEATRAARRASTRDRVDDAEGSGEASAECLTGVKALLDEPLVTADALPALAAGAGGGSRCPLRSRSSRSPRSCSSQQRRDVAPAVVRRPGRCHAGGGAPCECGRGRRCAR